MRKMHQNLKAGEIKVACDTVEDLWYLSTLIDPGDIVEAKTLRKIKIGEEGDSVKKPVFAVLKVEKAELSLDELRIAGTIVGGSEELPRGSHHSIKLDLYEPVMIRKEQWLNFQLAKIDEACSGGPAAVLILLHDREEAYFAKMTRTGYDVLAHMNGEVARKEMESAVKDFYAELGKHLLSYDTRYKPAKIIIASPAFFKEDLAKVLPQELKSKLIFATASSVSKNGIDEVLKRDETKAALAAHKSASEFKEVELLLGEIAKDGNYVYGWKDTKNAVDSGAVRKLLVSEGFIKTKRENKTFPELDYLMRTVDRMDGEIHIISDEHEGGKKLNGIGGIGAVTRYKLGY